METAVANKSKSIFLPILDCAFIILNFSLFKNLVIEKIKISIQEIVVQTIPIVGSRIGPPERKNDHHF